MKRRGPLQKNIPHPGKRAHRCDANRAPKRDHRQPHTRKNLQGLSHRQTKLIRRLADGWTLAVGATCQLVRGAVKGCKVRWSDVGYLVQAGLLSVTRGLTLAARLLLDGTKRILTVQRNDAAVEAKAALLRAKAALA